MRLHRDIFLPASKSESNRALMIAAYGGFSPDFLNLSDSNDTHVLAKAINEIQNGESVVDIADCGTAARFLCAFLACRDGEWILTGTDRMKHRPIAPLVMALRDLGADIQCLGEDGCLPLKCKGKTISGGKLAIDMTLSSQFASSLMLAAPMWTQGLELELLGELSSLPYLDMTLAMMRHFGAEAERIGRIVFVKPKPYQPADFKVSSDWTAASYWYEMAALSEECEIHLKGFFGWRFDKLSDLHGQVLEFVERPTSLQGDAVIAEWMKALGVSTLVDGESLVLTKTPFDKKTLSFDFSSTPDLFPTMAAVCAGMQVEARFTGIANLRLKESDRVAAMKAELAKTGAELTELSENELVLAPAERLPLFARSHPLQFDSSNDHRIVMALAPLALKLGRVVFDHPEVVAKSYPAFWDDCAFLRL